VSAGARPTRRTRPRRVRIDARAKLNLGLAVGPARRDGFHDLATIFQSVSLADTLTVEWRPRGFSLAVRPEDASVRVRRSARPAARPARRPVVATVPRGAANLVLRAARLLADEYDLPGGARFSLVKRIPAGAGLGGGSADAAAALIGLARLHGLRLGRAERSALGARLGSDVPFALLGGTALGLGRGERLKPLRLVRPFRAVLAVPAWRVSTSLAFQRLDLRKYGLTRWRVKLRFAQSVGREAITVERALRMGNTFEQVLGKRRSEFLSLCARLRRAGVEEPHLTGSGSAVFGIIPAGLSGGRVVTRFTGSEALYMIRSRGTGLTHYTLL
jgi:4-diphosphocytidyl-2-C-methyl-D-erythritol kinase